VQPPALGLLAAMMVTAQRRQVALAGAAAMVMGVGVVQVASRGAAAAARRGAGRVAGPDQVLEGAAGPVPGLGPGVRARPADDRVEPRDVQGLQQAPDGHRSRWSLARWSLAR